MEIKNIKKWFAVLIYLGLNFTQASDTKCPRKYTQLKNGENVTDVYCAEKPCVTKCCGINEFIYGTNKIYSCKSIDAQFDATKKFTDIFAANKLTYDLSSFDFFESVVDNNNTKVSKKKFYEHFNLLRNGILFDYKITSDCYKNVRKSKSKNSNLYLLEDGTLKGISSNKWYTEERRSFCVDILMGRTKPDHFVTHEAIYVLHEAIDNTKSIFLSCSLLISSFFIILVLLVYSVLPQLRNLGGMLLMAYLSALLCGNLIKAMTTLIGIVDSIDGSLCESLLSPLLYFFIMSSFMWLNIMSFDMWWTFRGEFYHRAVHRKGELVKFMWYALAVCSIAGIMTLTVVLIDKKSTLKIKPLLKTFLQNDESNRYYLYGPMTFLTACNFMFFLMTVFNIWRIKRDITKMNNASLSKKNKMFRSFVRISLLMGVSWILEMIQGYIDNTPKWLYIVINLYNACIGVVFFYFFVCNMDTFKKLANRFNLKSKFIPDKLNSSTKTTTSRPSTHKGSYSRTKTIEDDLEMTEDPTSHTKI